MRIATILLSAALAACSSGSDDAHLEHIEFTNSAPVTFLGGTGYSDLWFLKSEMYTPKELLHWNGKSLTPVTMPSQITQQSKLTAGKGGLWIQNAGDAIGRLDASGAYTDHPVSIADGYPNVIARAETTWLTQVEEHSGQGRLARWNGTTFVDISQPAGEGLLSQLFVLSDSLAWIPNAAANMDGIYSFRFDGSSWQNDPAMPPENAVALGAAGIWRMASSSEVATYDGLPIEEMPFWELDKWNGTALERISVHPRASWKKSGASYETRAVAAMGGKPALVHWRKVKDAASPTDTHSIIVNVLEDTTMGEDHVIHTFPTCELGCLTGYVSGLPDGTVIVKWDGGVDVNPQLLWGRLTE